MKTFRTYWMDDEDEAGDAAPRLRAVSRSAPPRPRWTVLYGTLGVVGALGTIAHAGVHDPTLITIIDVAFGGALFTVLSAWVHWNRVALSRLDERAAGTGRPHLRIARSRNGAPGRDVRKGAIRPDPDDRIVLPYDFT